MKSKVVNPPISPKSRQHLLTCLQQQVLGFHVAVQDSQTRQVAQGTEQAVDEDPTAGLGDGREGFNHSSTMVQPMKIRDRFHWHC